MVLMAVSIPGSLHCIGVVIQNCSCAITQEQVSPVTNQRKNEIQCCKSTLLGEGLLSVEDWAMRKEAQGDKVRFCKTMKEAGKERVKYANRTRPKQSVAV